MNFFRLSDENTVVLDKLPINIQIVSTKKLFFLLNLNIILTKQIGLP